MGVVTGSPPARAEVQQQVQDDTLVEDPTLVVERVASTSASRRGVSASLVKLLGIKTVPGDPLDPKELENPPFQPYTVPFSNLHVQRLRPYFFNRKWTSTDVGYGLFFLAMHSAALVLGPLTYSPENVQLALGLYLLTGGLGISLSYHRQLSHKSFRCVKPLEYFFAYMGVLAFEGDPVEWSKNHRWHHLHSDTPADRHSPRDGLYHAHFGWLFDERLTTRSGKDSLSPPWFFKESPEFYTWIRETYMWHQLGQAVLLFAYGGLPAFVWGFVIRILVTMHMTWLVNSVVHIWGDAPYESGDNSKNNAAVAILVFGDGWHNNHHAFEFSAAHGLEWWQIDVSYYFVCLLEKLGLAWDVKRPSQAQLNAKRKRSAATA